MITLWQVVLAAKTVPPHTVLLHGLRAWQTDPPPTRKAAQRGPVQAATFRITFSRRQHA